MCISDLNTWKPNSQHQSDELTSDDEWKSQAVINKKNMRGMTDKINYITQH